MHLITSLQCITLKKNCYTVLRQFYSEEKEFEFETFSVFLNRALENYQSLINEEILMFESLIVMRPQDFHTKFFDNHNPFVSFTEYSKRVPVNLTRQNFELITRLSLAACLPFEIIIDFYITMLCNDVGLIAEVI